MSPADMLLDIRIRKEEFRENLEEPFLPKIAVPWFEAHNVTPSRPHLMAAERLGPKWFLADLTKALFEWEDQMQTTTETPAYGDVTIFRAINSAFGAAVIMGSMLQFSPDWDLAHEDFSPADDVGTLLEEFWDAGNPMHELGPTIALRAAINMFRQADDE